MKENPVSVDNLLITQDSAIFWDTLSKKIESKLGTQPFQTWFSAVKMHSSDDKNIMLSAPNSFISDFIEQNYTGIIKSCVYETIRKDLELGFVIVDKAEDQKIVEKISKDMKTAKKQSQNGSLLNPAFTFENFVIGSSNEFAYTSALAVAEAPGRTNFNPLVIYGRTGLGKTHLMQAIAHFSMSEETADRVLYVTSNQFFDDYVHYVYTIRKSQEFYRRYRNIDILLIDDIHFLSRKWETQNQFFQIFEALTAHRKQIVISSDRHPDEIKDMKTRLLNRFSGGLLVDIQPPGYETKIAILKKKAEQDGISLPPDVLETIANCPTQNVRELDGILIRLIAYSNFTGQEITGDLIRQVLGDTVSAMHASVTTDGILTQVAKEFNISKNKLCALSRAREVAIPRQICMYLCKKYTKNSLATIGVTFNRNHSTVIHSIKRCEELLQTDSDVAGQIRNIERNLERK
jgi:chromosomal replication initiator protein